MGLTKFLGGINMLGFIKNLVGGLALISFTVVGGIANSASCPKTGGILKYGVKAEPPNYDMHGTNSYAIMHFVAQHYSTLLTFDWENFPKLEGDIAKSWEMAEDGLSYTFKLHENV